MSIKRLLGSTIAATIILACQNSFADTRTIIQNKGSDTLLTVAQAWAEAYPAVNPNVSVAISGGGSGTGASAGVAGTSGAAGSSGSGASAGTGGGTDCASQSS